MALPCPILALLTPFPAHAPTFTLPWSNVSMFQCPAVTTSLVSLLVVQPLVPGFAVPSHERNSRVTI